MKRLTKEEIKKIETIIGKDKGFFLIVTDNVKNSLIEEIGHSVSVVQLIKIADSVRETVESRIENVLKNVLSTKVKSAAKKKK